jgi:glycosyltransferase involved in cell wall biosynthesis
MKILHVIPSIGPLRGGPSSVIRDLAKGLAAEGAAVEIATTDDNGRGRLAVPLGVPVAEGGVTVRYFRRQTRFYTVSWPLTRWLLNHVRDYDLVHIHALFSYPSIAAALCCIRSRIPYIVRPLGTLNHWGMNNRRPWLKQISLRLVERRILTHAAAVHYTSQQEEQEAALLAPLSRGVIIPNPVSPPSEDARRGWLRATYPHLKDRRIILFLSRLDEKKGLDLLLDAFAEARRHMPNAMLVIAGDGPRKFVDGLRARVARLRIEDAVVWTGFLQGPERDGVLEDADVFVLSSYSENFGVSVVEAMRSGLPVIVSDQVGIHQEIARVEAGIVVPCSVDPLAKAMIRLITDRAFAAETGRRARRFAEQYSTQSVAKRLLEAYHDGVAS